MCGRRGLAARALLALVALTGAAQAQPAPAPPPASAPAPAPAPYGYNPYASRYPARYPPQPYYYAPRPLPPPKPLETPAERAKKDREQDAHADRVVEMPTAYTHPKGTLYLSSYDIALLQVGYAVSDTTQVSLTATPPLGPDHVFPADLTVKTRIVDESGFKLALTGSASGISGLNEGPMFVGRAGAIAQFCFDASCRTSLTAATDLLLAGPAMLATNGVGTIVPIAHWLSFIGEVETLMPLGKEVGKASGIAFGGGARLPYRTWALDLTVVQIVSGSDDTRATVPWLVFTYRFLP